MSSVLHPGFTSTDDHHEGLNPPEVDLHLPVKEKERVRLEILLDKECIELKGTGIDVEPAWLSGHVALHLSESTSIKEITLVFRGKARLPVPSHETMSLNSSPLTYIICNHEWSFLEGSKGHSHTLKAGKHFFPFQLQLGGSLPSTLSTSLYGGASIAYKLRAHAVRPGLAHNLTTVHPVVLIRGFVAEALEYQQTLEIENTWPEKVMYSIMIPHKAWAAGDTLTAVAKFSPLLKGVGVLNINTTIHETVKIYARGGGYQEHTRVVARSKHEIVGGKAVEVQEPSPNWSRSHTPAQTPSANTPSLFSAHRGTTSSGGSYFTFNPHPNAPSTSTSTAQASSSSQRGDQPTAGPSTGAATSSSTLSTPPLPSGFELSHDDIVTYITTPLPPHSITPTHALDPINVSHRIRWSILILNPDGHTSELRCSLPLHLLDWRLLDEARTHTAATRRLLIGGEEVENEDDEENELPSYTAHVRDRVANMYLPESATMRVPVGAWSPSAGRSGASSPMEGPGGLDSTSLDWVNSELLLSMSEEPEGASPQPPFQHMPSGSTNHSHPHSLVLTPPDSRPPSRGRSSRSHSTPTSRRSSPERHHHTHDTDGGGTYVHSAQASRNVHQLFKASMKPFTSISSSFGFGSRSGSHGNLASLVSHQTQSSSSPYSHYASGGSSSRPDSSHGNIHSASGTQSPRILPMMPGTGAQTPPLSSSPRTPDLNTVPDYRTASRGFLGGVPPLSSMRGLPSYEESNSSTAAPRSGNTDTGAGSGGIERTRSDGDLVSRFGAMNMMSSLGSRS